MDPNQLTIGQERMVETKQGFDVAWRGVCDGQRNLVASGHDSAWEIEGRQNIERLWMEDDHGICLESETEYNIFLAALKHMAEFIGWQEI